MVDTKERVAFMLEWKRRFALAAWIGFLALVGCSGGGSSQPTPSKSRYTFSPASIAGTVNRGNLVRSSDNWCWRNPLPTGNNVRAIWGSEADDVWAVGDGGTILHWDGSAWMRVSSGTTIGLSGVWGSGANDVWALGGGGTILNWDGGAWIPVSSGTTNALSGVWGSGADDVWAVGGGGTILHWDGSAWIRVSSGTASGLGAVWGSGASDVWAVGNGGTILERRR